MTKAKHALPRRGRFVVPIVVTALVVGGAVAAVQLWPDDEVVGATPGVATSSASTPAPTAAVSASPSSSAVPPAPPGEEGTPSPAQPVDEAAQTALSKCRAKVGAADEVLNAAKTGVRHWDEHVQAQTDANKSKITQDELNKIFSRTRLAGPGDMTGYNKATKAYADLDGSCAEVSDAPAEVNKVMAQCQQRADAQSPVLKAGKDGMADWDKHLRAMNKSRTENVSDAAKIWQDAWRAAPKNINAWKSAMGGYQPPKC